MEAAVHQSSSPLAVQANDACEGSEAASLAAYAVPALLDLEPWPAQELDAIFRGDPEADACEQMLAQMARVRGALDVELAEGLAALRKGDRLARLACHLEDYAREVLGRTCARR
jgi:hypothetical protein